MKAGWEVKALGEVCTKIQDGAHESPKNTYPEPASGRFPYLTSKNIRNGYLDLSDISYVDELFHNSIYPRCNAELGDVLLTKDGSNTGNVTLNTLDEPFSTLSSVCLLKPDRRVLSAAFLTYYLRSSEGFEQITGQMTGAAIKRIILKTIKASTIPLPPLDEQKRIVEVLDAAFEGLSRARAHTETNLQNARELFETTMREVCQPTQAGWQKMLVADTVTKTKVPNKIQRKAYLDEGEYPVVSQEAEQINGFWNDVADVVKVTRPLVVFGDHTRALKYVDFDFVVGADGTQLMAPIKAIDPRFYFYALRTIDLEGKGYARHYSHLKKCEISFPNEIADQKKIADNLEELENAATALQSHYRVKLADLDALRQALLQKAFAGELT